jgi:5-hydroxyisourate hydrolase-like protein (transthyretin family)
MSVSVSVVDGVYGRPAVNVAVWVKREVDGVLTEQWHPRANDDGHISCLQNSPLTRGSYALELDLEGLLRHVRIHAAQFGGHHTIPRARRGPPLPAVAAGNPVCLYDIHGRLT